MATVSFNTLGDVGAELKVFILVSVNGLSLLNVE